MDTTKRDLEVCLKMLRDARELAWSAYSEAVLDSHQEDAASEIGDVIDGALKGATAIMYRLATQEIEAKRKWAASGGPFQIIYDQKIAAALRREGRVLDQIEDTAEREGVTLKLDVGDTLEDIQRKINEAIGARDA